MWWMGEEKLLHGEQMQKTTSFSVPSDADKAAAFTVFVREEGHHQKSVGVSVRSMYMYAPIFKELK